MKQRIVFIRIDDGERFIMNDDYTFSMERTCMFRPYKYSFDRLMSDNAFRVEMDTRENPTPSQQ